MIIVRIYKWKILTLKKTIIQLIMCMGCVGTGTTQCGPSYWASGHATALAVKYFLLTLSRCIQPRLTIYVCQQQARHQPPIKPGGGDGECSPCIFVTCARTSVPRHVFIFHSEYCYLIKSLVFLPCPLQSTKLCTWRSWHCWTCRKRSPCCTASLRSRLHTSTGKSPAGSTCWSVTRYCVSVTSSLILHSWELFR